MRILGSNNQQKHLVGFRFLLNYESSNPREARRLPLVLLGIKSCKKMMNQVFIWISSCNLVLPHKNVEILTDVVYSGNFMSFQTGYFFESYNIVYWFLTNRWSSKYISLSSEEWILCFTVKQKRERTWIGNLFVLWFLLTFVYPQSYHKSYCIAAGYGC